MTLVDTGVNTSYAWQSLKNQIKKTGNELDDLEQVILTHLHQDHVGLVDKLKKKRGNYMGKRYRCQRTKKV